MGKYVIMPKLGFNMREGRIVKWLKLEGEKVQEQEAILQIETDKSVIDVEAHASGVLRKIFAQEGEVIPVTLPIGIIASPEEDIDTMIQEALNKLENIGVAKVNQGQVEQEKDIKKESRYSQKKFETIKISPRAKKKARELEIDLEQLKSEFPKEIIQEEDIIEFTQKKDAIKTDTTLAKTIIRETSYSGIRKIIGDRLSESKLAAPHIYLSNSVDMHNTLELLDNIKKEKDVNITINDFLIFVLTKVLIDQPKLNSSLVEDKIIYYSSVNIGIAVGLEEGLIVPVLKRADKKNLIEISIESKRLISSAREKKLMPDDYQNGTFTLSNLGMFGIEEFTAIINPPESGILAVGSIQKKPVVDNYNQILIRPIMRIVLSVDHRIVDGIDAALFLNKVKKFLEEPYFFALKD